MLVDVLVVAGASFRRQLRPAVIVLTLLFGVGLGLLQRSLPQGAPWSTESWQVAVVGVVLVGLLAGSQRDTERRARWSHSPLASLAWSGGELFGGAVAAGVLLALLLGGTRAGTYGMSAHPQLVGLAQGADQGWRFELPAGSTGPFPLELDAALPLTSSGRLAWSLERGAERAAGSTQVDTAGRVRVLLPDLSPARGNLVLRLRATDGLVLGREPPRLSLGQRALLSSSPWLSHAARRHLLLVSLITLAAGCAFARGTASLAGLLGLALEAPATPSLFGLALLLLTAFAWVSTCLRRRTLSA
ncbi:MAG: hypothetical protein DHS20C15_11200 [Planctomycetota bacterium]|nr:MAG: hypothetical protein DHS20C15_11200 [Planctomycetota bacterium]